MRMYTEHFMHSWMLHNAGVCVYMCVWLWCAECSTVANGIIALLGVASYSSVPAVLSFAKKFHIPLVTPAAVPLDNYNDVVDRPHGYQAQYNQHNLYTDYLPRTSVNNTNGFGVYLRPVYHKAMLDLIKHFRWTQLYYLYDTDQGTTS